MKSMTATLVTASLCSILAACGGGATSDDGANVFLQSHPVATNAGPLATLVEAVPRRTAALSTASLRTLDASSFFNWAESAYPGLFVAPQSNKSIDIWTYRYYPTTDIYLGTSTFGDVLGLVGTGSGEYTSVPLGRLTQFSCQVYPSDCMPSDGVTKASIIPLDYSYFVDNGNILVDGNHVILAGGQSGNPAGATHNGSLAFSDRVIIINAENGIKNELIFKAETGNPFDPTTVGTGIGNSATISKLGNSRYLISGGFQYIKTMSIVDLPNNSITSISSDFKIPAKSNVPYTTPFFANGQGISALSNGKIAFFGYNDGGWPHEDIMIFDPMVNLLSISSTKLTMARSHIAAKKMNDGRILLVSGSDGTPPTTANSAPRRTEIYDPIDGSITRMADTPAPYIGNYRNITPIKITDNEVCVDDYKYTINSDKWSAGCDLSDSESNNNYIPGRSYVIPDGSNFSGAFIGKTSNGRNVFYMYSINSKYYSDACDCYPISEPSKIVIY